MTQTLVLKKIYSFLRKLKTAIQRTLPSIDHKAAWANYETALAYRANIAFLSKVVFTSFYMPIGIANYQQSKEYIDAEKPHNEELMKTMFPILQWTMIIMTFGRLILMAISMKKLSICKTYIYYQVLYGILEDCLPRDFGDMQSKLSNTNNIMNFCLLYFDFWPNCLTMSALPLVQLMTNTFVYDKNMTGSLIWHCIAATGWQFFSLLMCHMVINAVGLIFVEADILRSGNEQLLNNLKEGVIIMDQESGFVHFVNKAAKRFSIRKNRYLGVSMSIHDNEACPSIDDRTNTFDKGQELFALIDMKILNA